MANRDLTVKMSLRVFLLTALNCLVAVTFFLTLSNYLRIKNDILNQRIKELDHQNTIILQGYENMAKAFFSLNIQNQQVTSILYRGLSENTEDSKSEARDLLLKELGPFYSTIKQYHFRQLHFHQSDNRSFLRFHRPEKFGDDLTGVRFSVEYVNLTKEYISGFEEGRIFNGYRYVFPLYHKNSSGENLFYTGSVEISISMETIIEQLERNFGKNVQFILSREVMEEKVFSEEQFNYIPWPVDDRFVMDRAVSTSGPINDVAFPGAAEQIKKALTEEKGKNRPFSLILGKGSRKGIGVFLPVINFEGKTIGWLISTEDYNELGFHFRSFIYSTIILSLLFLIISFFLLYYYFSQRKIEEMATFDTLTHVFSRAVFFRFLEHEDIRFKRYRQIYSIVMIDIDHFKKINDTWGHLTGDFVLKEVAEIIRKSIRQSDTLGRYGGEEFLISLPSTNLEQAADVAEKIRKAIEGFYFKDVGHLTVSCGVAQRIPEMKVIDDLIRGADINLYRAKQEGRNRTVY